MRVIVFLATLLLNLGALAAFSGLERSEVFPTNQEILRDLKEVEARDRQQLKKSREEWFATDLGQESEVRLLREQAWKDANSEVLKRVQRIRMLFLESPRNEVSKESLESPYRELHELRELNYRIAFCQEWLVSFLARQPDAKEKVTVAEERIQELKIYREKVKGVAMKHESLEPAQRMEHRINAFNQQRQKKTLLDYKREWKTLGEEEKARIFGK